LVAVLTRHRDDQVVSIQDDLCPAYPNAVDPLFDDLPSLVEGVPGWWPTVNGPGGEGHPGAALQVDA
jgi:hypothetical protein